MIDSSMLLIKKRIATVVFINAHLSDRLVAFFKMLAFVYIKAYVLFFRMKDGMQSINPAK